MLGPAAHQTDGECNLGQSHIEMSAHQVEENARDPYRLPELSQEIADAIQPVGIDPGSRDLAKAAFRGDSKAEPQTFRYILNS